MKKIPTILTILISIISPTSKAQVGTLTGWGMSICNQYSFSICPGQTITPYDYGAQTYVCNMTTMPDVSFVNQGPVWRVAKHNWNFVATGANALITGVNQLGNTVTWPFVAGAVLSPGAYTTISGTNFVTFDINNSPIAFTVNENNFKIELTGGSTTITANSSTICMGKSATLTASGATNYTWSPVNLNASSIVVNPNSTTVYTVTGNSGNCTFGSTKQVTVTVNANPTVSIAGKTVVCRGKSLNLNASGATTYSWSSGATVSNITVSPQTSTSYTVTGNLANGCSAKAVITVSVSECIGIEELNASEGASVLVYPNPNKGEFIIETAVETDIRIVNALGQIILQHHLSEGKNKINLGEHAIGIYFVKTKTTNYKIIKE